MRSRGLRPVLWVVLSLLLLLPAVVYLVWAMNSRTPLGSSTMPPLGKDYTNSIGMNFKWIEPGTFRMGSPDSDKSDYNEDKPQHEVEISKGYYLGTYPVTRGQFAAFVKETDYKTEAEKAGDGATWRKPSDINWSADYVQTDNDPVVETSWNDARAFCDWLSKKEGRTYELPTEAEWEYAGRAGTPTAYSFGDDPAKLGDYAWFNGNSGSHTHPVGQKKPNPWGLYDMSGNVGQWCADGFGPYAGGYIKDPKGNDNSKVRVLRGGSFCDIPWGCRSDVRGRHAPVDRSYGFGFRVVLRPPYRSGDSSR